MKRVQLTGKQRLKVAVAVATLAVALVGCRGETKTLDEVVAIAKGNYTTASATLSSVPAHTSIVKVATDLELALNTKDFSERKKAVTEIGAGLAGLVDRAGIPSRAAMGELASQYRALSALDSVQDKQIKLLAARTYSLLATELNTTKFGL